MPDGNFAWTLLRGYSIEAQLKADGLSFDAFDIVSKTFKESGTKKLRNKVVGRLGSELRLEYKDARKSEKDLNAVVNGCYCIGLGGDYNLRYSKKFSSRIVYIGSGRVFSRVKSHLTARLFDFARAMPGVPLQFHICDLDGSKFERKLIEQCLLNRFSEMSDGVKPLLNKKDAKSGVTTKSNLPTGWDKPLHKSSGGTKYNWLIQPKDFDSWKGALD